MYALLALTATVLTSFLPILNKRILRDARPAFVAWAINAFSLPILAIGTFLLAQCRFTPVRNAVPFSCTTQLPQLDSIFLIALLASVVLNWGAPLFGFSAIALGLVGYVTALFKLSAVFTIVWAWLFLGEGNIRQRVLGTLVMLAGGALIAV